MGAVASAVDDVVSNDVMAETVAVRSRGESLDSITEGFIHVNLNTGICYRGIHSV